MNLLDNHQVRIIESDVEKARITINHLSQELTDHICCEVESLMIGGKSFDEAYHMVKEQTGIKVLQEIQDNTLYLTNAKYALMKTTMKVTGNIALALLALGTVFKIFHWPGAGVSLVLGFFLLCLVFFPAAVFLRQRDDESKGGPVLNFSLLTGGISFMIGILFKVQHWPGAGMLLFTGWSILLLIFLPLLLTSQLKKAEGSREKVIYVLGVVALIIFELAAMFKMFHWPGAGILLLAGSILLVSVFIPLFSHLKFKTSADKTGQFIFLITTSMFVIILTALMSMNVSSDVFGRFVRKDLNAEMINSYFKLKRNALTASAQVLPQTSLEKIREVSQSADNLQSLIASIKLNLVQSIDNVGKAEAMKALSNPELIIAKDNYDHVNSIMLGHDGNGLGKTLKKEIESFRATASKHIADSDLKLNAIKLLDTQNSNGSWEERTFRNNMLISTLSMLSALENNVRVIESKAIESIRKKNI